VRHIESVAQLEALLFLQARPSERWNVASVAARLYAPFADMAAALAGARLRWILGQGRRALSLCSYFGSRHRC
jgi:hypothetical protein